MADAYVQHTDNEIVQRQLTFLKPATNGDIAVLDVGADRYERAVFFNSRAEKRLVVDCGGEVREALRGELRRLARGGGALRGGLDPANALVDARERLPRVV